MRLLGALAFAAVCLLVLAGRPGDLRAADPVAPAPELFAQDAPFTRSQQVSLSFVAPDEGGPVSQFRASNDAATSGGILSNGVSVPANSDWSLAAGADGPRTIYGQVKYESGLWSPVASISLTLDRTPSSSLAVDIDSVGARVHPPASFDWHARTATPEDQLFGQGSGDGNPDPTSVGVGDEQHFIILQGSDEPLAPGSYDVHRRTDFGCEDACVVVGAMGSFCEASGGSFTVTDVAYSPEGDLEVLDADFRVECIDTLMSGSIRYGAARDIVALDQDAESLLYPDVTLGDSSAERSLSFTNIGTTSTTLGDADLVGGERDDFAITSDDCSGATLGVGESCDVGVRFTPSDLGRRRAFLEIPDETPRGSRHVMVQGDGAAPTPPTAGTVIVARGERCTDTRSVKVRATGATDAAGIDRLELSNLADDGYLSRPIEPPQRWTLTAGDGRKTVHARWWNVAGQASAVVKDAILLDTTAPEASAPKASIRAGVRVIDDRVRVRLAWTGSDATCGIADYDVALSRNDHQWKRIDETTATHLARHLRVGPTYQVKVRANDKADNVGDWAAGLTFRIVGSNAHPRIEVVEP